MQRLCILIFSSLFAGAATPQSVELISVNGAGTDTGNGASGALNGFAPVISADGRFVAFTSRADDIGPADTNGVEDVYVRDRATATTELISQRAGGDDSGDGPSRNPSITADGRFVLYSSNAGDLVPNDTNSSTDIFLRDRERGTTELVSDRWDGSVSADDDSLYGILSADGSTAVFISAADDLVTMPTPAAFDYYARDLRRGVTELLTIDRTGTTGAASSPDLLLALALPSADGRYVVFTSDAEDLVAIPTAGFSNIYVRDRQASTTQLVSRRLDTSAGGNESSTSANISADGRYVAFVSTAADLVATDVNGAPDTFLAEVDTGMITLVSVDLAGNQSAQQGVFSSGAPTSFSPSGRFVAFSSLSDDIAPDDDNGQLDVFVFDRSTDRNRLISRNVDGASADGASIVPSFSSFDASGRYVVFNSIGTDLTSDLDLNDAFDGFVFDLRTGEALLATLAVGGHESSDTGGSVAGLSADGSALVLFSDATNLAVEDNNDAEDTYVFLVPVERLLPIPTLRPAGLFAFLVALSIAGLLSLRRPD